MRLLFLGVVFVAAAATFVHGDILPTVSSESFDDSVGINTHFGYSEDPSTTWYTYAPLVTDLVSLGVTHVRDGLYPTYALNSSYANSNYMNAMKALGQNGIGVDAVTDPGQTYGSLGTIQSSVNAVIALNTQQPGTVQAVEGPNEKDQAASWTFNGNTYEAAYPEGSSTPLPIAANSYNTGITLYQTALYNAFKGNSATSSLKVIAPSEGGTYSIQYTGSGTDYSQPVQDGALSTNSDWGNVHPYTFGGNYETQHFSYDTISGWYYGNSQSPGVNISPATVSSPGGEAFIFQNYSQPFEKFTNGVATSVLPMVATEKGYYTGTAQGSVSQSTFAKYIPRIFADDVLYGIQRTYSYELADEGTDQTNIQDNFGLLYANGSPKPAYYTLQHMLAILKTASISATSLNYSVNTIVPPAYQQSPWQPDTVLHLLLQNSDGSYALLLWNDVSSSSLTDASGNTLTGTARDISVPDFSTNLDFGTSMNSNVTMYGLDPYGNTAATTLDTSSLTIVNGQLTVNVPDYIEILELRPASVPEPASLGLLTLASIAPLLRRRKVRASWSHLI